MDFCPSFWYSFIITVSSVALILLCCSMRVVHYPRAGCAVQGYVLSVRVQYDRGPFQMVMFTLAKTADTLKLNNPYNICIIYLGFRRRPCGVYVHWLCQEHAHRH